MVTRSFVMAEAGCMGSGDGGNLSVLALQRLASTACWRVGLMLVLLAMARCAGVCGVDTTKAGNVLSGERCDLRNVLCGRCKVRVSKCMCRHSRLKGKRMMFIGDACHELD